MKRKIAVKPLNVYIFCGAIIVLLFQKDRVVLDKSINFSKCRTFNQVNLIIHDEDQPWHVVWNTQLETQIAYQMMYYIPVIFLLKVTF